MISLNKLFMFVALVLLDTHMLASAEAQPKQTSTLTRRFEIRELNAAQLQELRDAFQTAFKNKKFEAVAADHGRPNWFCPHGDLRFLPWHRRFIRRVEEALGGIPLPYWDWTKEGEPTAITNATYVDAKGVTRYNPLSYFVMADGYKPEISRTWSITTARLARAAKLALSSSSFEDHSWANETPHDTVHVQLGGDMATVSTSSYVPIFWFHHCFVDKLWYDWQILHPGAAYPYEARGQMKDSDGTFQGIKEIKNLSGWQRGGKSRKSSVDSSSTPDKRLVLVLKDFQPTVEPELVEVQCLGKTIGSVYSLGMEKPMLIFTDHPVDVTEAYNENFKTVSTELLMAPGTCKLIELNPVTKAKTESPQLRVRILFHWTEF